MRPEDWRELSCQLPEGTQPVSVAWFCMQGEAWVALYRDQPVAAFGASPMAVSVLSVWAWGTPRFARVARAVGRHITDVLAPRWLDEGITRVEARSIVGHDTAHRWMTKLGAQRQPCPEWGRGREDFVLFSWTADNWRSTPR